MLDRRTDYSPNVPTDRVVPETPRATPTLLVGGRLIPVPDRVAVEVGTDRSVTARVQGPGIAPRHACFVRLGPRRLLVRALDPERRVTLAGAAIRSGEVAPGSVLRLGRLPVVVGESGFSARFPRAFRWQGIVARDPASLAALSRLATVAAGSAPVWVSGESGTGKELAARAVHAASGRSGAFVALNCGALPDTLAEGELFGVRRGAFTGATADRPGALARADRGSLLLDEIGELSPSVQAKLLRVLETGEVQPLGGDRCLTVDARVVAATWRDPRELECSGGFRFDLLQRLEVLRVDLPPLRARPGDIGPLLEAFLDAHEAGDLWPEPELLTAIERAPWPGNVRQLRTCATRAAVWGDPTELVPDAPPASGPLPRRGTISDQVAVARVARVLQRVGGNRALAARTLGVSRSTLYRWLARAAA